VYNAVLIAYFKAISRHLSGRNEINYKKSRLGELISGTRDRNRDLENTK
jgi:hypothetical protein